MTLYFRLLWILFSSRFRAPTRGLEAVNTSFRVWPTDLDVLGHMTNSRYLNLMDAGRMDMLARAGVLSELKARGWYPVVVEESIQFRRSLHPFEKFQLRTEIKAYNERHFLIHQTFLVKEKVAAVGVVRGRFLGPNKQRVSPAEVLHLAHPDGDTVVEIPQPQEEFHHYLRALAGS